MELYIRALLSMVTNQADMCYSLTNQIHASLVLLGHFSMHGIAWQAILYCCTVCRVFIDVMNEPDSMGIKWEPSSGHPGARELYLETLDALHSMVPEGLLYILEGAHSNASLVAYSSSSSNSSRLTSVNHLQ